MIPAEFAYVRPETLDEAVEVLAEHGDEAKVLAGGHSLIPLLRIRFAAPEVLVDVGRIDELRGVSQDDGHLRIGAMTTHHEITTDDLVAQHCGVLAEVTAHIGDPAVRHRGTFGGAIAHADPAGDLPGLMLALDARMVAAGPDGERTITAVDFFVDLFQSALADDEVLVAVEVPRLEGDWGWRYEKMVRSAQAWAIVGSAAAVRREDGNIAEARIGLTNMGSRPVRARATEDALASGADVATACDQAADGTSPPSDLNADADFRRHLARVLTRRALSAAVEA